jgi:hypothetical protein
MSDQPLSAKPVATSIADANLFPTSQSIGGGNYVSRAVTWATIKSELVAELAIDFSKIYEIDSQVEVIDTGADGRIIFTTNGVEIGRMDPVGTAAVLKLVQASESTRGLDIHNTLGGQTYSFYVLDNDSARLTKGSFGAPLIQIDSDRNIGLGNYFELNPILARLHVNDQLSTEAATARFSEYDGTTRALVLELTTGIFAHAWSFQVLSSGLEIRKDIDTTDDFFARIERSSLSLGIGTALPDAKIHILDNGSPEIELLRLEVDNQDLDTIVFRNAGGGGSWAVLHENAGDLTFRRLFTTLEYLRFGRTTPAIGIFQTVPAGLLHVTDAGTSLTSILLAEQDDENTNALALRNADGTDFDWKIRVKNNDVLQVRDNGNTERLWLHSSGYLGVSAPSTAPTDGDISANQAVAYLDETNYFLTWRGKLSDSTFQSFKASVTGQSAKKENLTAHGFVVGDVLRRTSGSWAKAQADSVANSASTAGIVVQVVDANNFVIAFEGYVTGLSGLTDGSVHWLSPTTAGAFTTTQPSTTGQIIKEVLVAFSTTTAMVRISEGIEVP